MKPRFRCRPCTFRHVDSHRLPDPYLTHQVRLFPHRSPRWCSTSAAVGGLKPLPAERLRRAYLHLPRSTASRSSTYRQPPFSVRDTPLRIPHGSLTSVTCAPWPCGPALPVSRLAGRYPCDYYGHSVAIGLAPLRRSHVRQCCTYQRDLGVPFVSFNALTGHRSSAPEDYSRFVVTLLQGPVPVSGVFPVGVALAPSGD